jgi:quinoprotein glucose dehydrogenase
MTRDEVNKTSPESAKTCAEQFDRLVHKGAYTLYGIQPSLVFPSSEGGGGWGGAAFDPGLGYLFVNTRSVGTAAHLETRDSGGQPSYAKVKEPFEDKDGYPCNAPPWGELAAVNANTGDIAWRIPLGEYPELAAKGIKNTGTPNAGAPIVTAGGLVFIGATTDFRFRAFEAKTGKLLWSAELESSAIATPITYQGSNGKQYVVIGAGGAGHLRPFVKSDAQPAGDLVVAFSQP